MCNYAPTLKKLKRHIALGLSVLPFVRPLQKSSYSLEILLNDLYKKMTRIFSANYLPLWSYAPFKGS